MHSPERTQHERQGERRIGEILLAENKITPEQLQHAVEVKQDDSRGIGEILLAMNYISRQDLAQALAERNRVPYMELGEKDVEPGVLSLVDQKILRRHAVMPVRVDEGGKLEVAMSDPSNIPAIEDLRMISGYSISPVVALDAEIQQVQNKLFSIGEDVSDILQGSEQVEEEESGELEIGGESEDAPVVKLVSSVIQRAVGEGASDIHMEPRSGELSVRFRVDGVLREIMSVPQRMQRSVIVRLKIMGDLDIAEHRIPQDGRFTVKIKNQRVDFRVAALPASFGEKIVLRILDTSSVEANLKDLGFSPKVLEKYREIFSRPYGAVLVTGPTGSGKSTTLYATLKELHSPEKNIITVEDPVEFKISGLN
jgi:type IV pilus assembly protein PilB